MKYCPKCNKNYEDKQEKCDNCDVQIIGVSLQSIRENLKVNLNSKNNNNILPAEKYNSTFIIGIIICCIGVLFNAYNGASHINNFGFSEGALQLIFVKFLADLVTSPTIWVGVIFILFGKFYKKQNSKNNL